MSRIALATWVRALWASLEHCWLAGELPKACVPVWSGVESVSSPALVVRKLRRSVARSSEIPSEGRAATAAPTSAASPMLVAPEKGRDGSGRRLLPRGRPGKPFRGQIRRRGCLAITTGYVHGAALP